MKTVGILLTSPIDALRDDYVKPFKEALDTMSSPGSVSYKDHAPSTHLTDAAAMRKHAEELMKQKPDVIWLISTATARAALDARTTSGVTPAIPIVGSAFSSEIRDLAQAAPDFTGIVNKGWELGVERFARLLQLMPNLKTVGVLVNPDNESSRNELNAIEQAARDKGVTVITANMRNASEVETAFSQLKEKKAEAVMTTHLPLFQNNRADILRLAGQQNIPVVGHRSLFVADGALMAYGSILEQQIKQSADVVHQILADTDPAAANQPLMAPTAFECVVSSRALAHFNVTVPANFAARSV